MRKLPERTAGLLVITPDREPEIGADAAMRIWPERMVEIGFLFILGALAACARSAPTAYIPDAAGPPACDVAATRPCSCPVGYSGVETCETSRRWSPCICDPEQTDRCNSGNGGCDPLTTCTDTAAGRTCGPCPFGYTGTGETSCEDIDECLDGNGGCSKNGTCTNTAGSRTCECLPGYSGDGITCYEIGGECVVNNGGCSPNAICATTSGHVTCTCKPGYSGDGHSCDDIDECLVGNGGCSASAMCTNTPGSRNCTCEPGYSGDGTACDDINECLEGNGGCSANAVCTNTPGSLTCACNPGYSGDGLHCSDIDECLYVNGGCSANAICTNTPGSRTCACKPGHSGDGLYCNDINECLDWNGGCSANAICTNTPGSRTCACKPGYSGDGLLCYSVQEPLAAAQPLAAGSNFTCALTAVGAVKCWGLNYYGALGTGDTANRNIPTQVVGLSSGTIAITAGSNHACALMETGEMRCWGSNTSAQLGMGDTSNRYIPVQVSGLSSGVIALSAGIVHTCGLMIGGELKCWGYNYFGALGTGDTTTRYVPTQVSGLSSGVFDVSAGAYHTCALTNAGEIKCWGRNDGGQLGTGDTAARNVPTPVSGLASGVMAISAGDNHTCALLDTGAMKCWGQNNRGQLGTLDTGVRLTPTQVSGMSSWVAGISAGGSHTCALTLVGEMKCWGDNIYGALGTGAGSGIFTYPTQVSGLSSGVLAMSLGNMHTCAQTDISELKCWGYNYNGQLGTGDTTVRLTPVQVVGF